MTFHLFSAETYTERRDALMAAMGKGVVLICGNQTSPINYAGNVYRFRQDSTFLYYGGIDLPGLNLVLDIEKGKTILYGDEQTLSDQIWSGARESLTTLAEKVGISEVKPADALVPDYASGDIQCLPPYHAEHYWLLQKINQHADCSVVPSTGLIKAVVAQREIKSAEEIAQMEDALTITARMHTKVMQSARAGMTEAMLAGIAEGIALAHLGMTAYGTILSKNGEILHNNYYGNVLAETDLVLGDFGAENKMHYAGDITRTFPVAKTFSSQQKEIYELVLKAQVNAVEAVQPGRPFREIHLDAARTITEGLISLGVMQGDVEEAVMNGAHALFFPHGLGHMIGLDVHEMEGLGEDYVGYDENVTRSDQFGLAYLRMAKPLKQGHVVTVEPGIYFIPALMDQWRQDGKHADFINYEVAETYRGFGGVRIEDNVMVTKNGYRILGPSIAKAVAEVEALRG
jgi:Xaa-Pro aminopeptidase